MMNWRKSTFSGSNGDCIEIANDWRKSRRSAAGNCVEIASGVRVRDTQQHGTGPVLTFTPGAWAEFTGRLSADAR